MGNARFGPNNIGRASSVGTESYDNNYTKNARIDRKKELDTYNRKNNTNENKYQSYMAQEGGKNKKSYKKRKTTKSKKNKRNTKRNRKI